MWVNDCAQASKHSGNKTLLSVLSAALTSKAMLWPCMLLCILVSVLLVAVLSSEKVDADIIDPRPIIQALLDIGWTIPIAEEQVCDSLLWSYAAVLINVAAAHV